MKITVIIVNYYSSKLIKRLIAGICSHNMVLKIVVVDNSNCPKEYAKLLEILNICKKVTIVNTKKNLGFAKGCNAGLKEVETDFFMLLNPDTYIDEKSLDVLLKRLKKCKKAGAVSPIAFWDKGYKFYLPPLILPSPLWDVLNSAAFRFYLIRKIINIYVYRKMVKSLNKNIKTGMLSGGHLLIKSDILKKIGYLFDENFFMYYEDSDLCRRIKKAGYDLILEKDAKVVHYWQDSQGKIDLQKDTKEYYYKKHFKFLKFWKFLQRIIEKFPLKEPKKYINLGEIKSLNKINNIVEKYKPCTVELGFHYTFVPAILYSAKKDTKTEFNEIAPYLKNGEYWLRIDRKKIYKFNFKKN